MHLLPCPKCDSSITVSPSEAGQSTVCPSCRAEVDVPTLGRLRQLPQAEQTTAKAVDQREVSTGRQIAFMLFGLIATASLLTASYCGIRWALIDVPADTETHIAELQQQYQKLSAAELVREYEQMEEYGLELGQPYVYQVTQNQKDSWGRSASIAAAVGGLSVLGAVAVGFLGRKRN